MSHIKIRCLYIYIRVYTNYSICTYARIHFISLIRTLNTSVKHICAALFYPKWKIFNVGNVLFMLFFENDCTKTPWRLKVLRFLKKKKPLAWRLYSKVGMFTKRYWVHILLVFPLYHLCSVHVFQLFNIYSTKQSFN